MLCVYVDAASTNNAPPVHDVAEGFDTVSLLVLSIEHACSVLVLEREKHAFSLSFLLLLHMLLFRPGIMSV